MGFFLVLCHLQHFPKNHRSCWPGHIVIKKSISSYTFLTVIIICPRRPCRVTSQGMNRATNQVAPVAPSPVGWCSKCSFEPSDPCRAARPAGDWQRGAAWEIVLCDVLELCLAPRSKDFADGGRVVRIHPRIFYVDFRAPLTASQTG